MAINQQAETTFAGMDEDRLKKCLINLWEKFEQKYFRDEMAPLLFHLREKLRAPGRQGKGFEKWVKDNLGIAIRTANRWASWYEEQVGMSKPRRPKLESLGLVADTLPDEAREPETSEGDQAECEPSPDDVHPVPFQLMLTDAQEAEWDHAIERLTPDTTKVIFEAVITAAAKLEPILATGIIQ